VTGRCAQDSQECFVRFDVRDRLAELDHPPLGFRRHGVLLVRARAAEVVLAAAYAGMVRGLSSECPAWIAVPLCRAAERLGGALFNRVGHVATVKGGPCVK
jgi:hypothetical protein